jgi:phage N-6-adenine-methyltransferase
MKTSGGRADWATPPEVFDFLSHNYGPFDLDACATIHNTKCERYIDYYTSDALLVDWEGSCVWCNPPYNDIPTWVEKAILEVNLGHAKQVGMLLPADVSTKWFRTLWESAYRLVFLQPRIRFVGAESSPPFASMLVHWIWPLRMPGNPLVALNDWRLSAGKTS